LVQLKISERMWQHMIILYSTIDVMRYAEAFLKYSKQLL